MQTVKVFNSSNNKLPEYSDKGSSGVDLRANIESIKDNKFLFDAFIKEDCLIINPGGRALIPTGLHVSFDNNYEIQIRDRSGLALKNGIIVTNGIGTIDASYRGDIGVILTNTGSKAFTVHQGDRIAQAVLCPVSKIFWQEVNTIEDLDSSDRGEGGFGHSGLK